MKAQFAQEFERVLGPHQGSRRLVEPIEEPRQQKPQRAAAGEQWQCREFRRGQRPGMAIIVEQQARLRHIEAAIGLETPGVEANRQIVGEKVGAGEVKVDQPGEFAIAKKHVVRKQIGMDDPGRQGGAANRFERANSLANSSASPG